MKQEDYPLISENQTYELAVCDHCRNEAIRQSLGSTPWDTHYYCKTHYWIYFFREYTAFVLYGLLVSTILYIMMYGIYRLVV